MPCRQTLHRWRRFARLGALGALIVVVSGGICQPKPKWDPPGIPQIAEADVTPSVVYAAPNTTFELEARAFTPAGRVIEIGAYPQITVEWSSASAGFSDAAANPVIVKVPSSASGSIDVVATIKRLVTRPGTGTVETTATATVSVKLPAAFASSVVTADAFEVEYIQDRRPVTLILDAMEGTTCINDWSIAVVKAASLGRNLTQGCANNPWNAPETALFWSDREMVFKDKSKFSDWTPASDVRKENSLPAPSFRSIGVLIGLDVDTGQVKQWATEEVERAHAVMDKTGTGILIEPAETFVHGHVQDLSDLDAACDKQFLNQLLAGGGFSIDDRDLFVLFVHGMIDDIRGYACPRNNDQLGRVIYLSWSEYHPTTIAHELGHMLSLVQPDIETGNGHANYIGEFRQDNIMWSSDDFAIRQRRDRFSVGQIFRMNLSGNSWLNMILDPSIAVKRDCQPEITMGVCPAIDMDYREPGS